MCGFYVRKFIRLIYQKDKHYMWFVDIRMQYQLLAVVIVVATYYGKKVQKTIRLFKDTTGYDNRLVDFRSVNIEL